jgi:pectinesterase
VTAFSGGAWTLENATLETRDIGVFTPRTTGAWTIQNTTIESRQQGIHAVKTNASWTVSESTISVTAEQNAIGVDARPASEGWSLDDVTIDSPGVDVAE